MKKIIVLIVVFLTFLSPFTPVIHAENISAYEIERVEIDTLDSFLSYFGEYEIENQDLSISLDYIDESTIYSRVSYSFSIDNSNYYINSSGCCVKENEYYSGMLVGNLSSNEGYHEVISNLIIKDGKAQFDISIQKDDTINNPICFTVGSQLLYVNNSNSSEKSISNNEASTYSTCSYSLVGNKCTSFSSSTGLSGYSQDTRVYFNKSVNRVAVGIKSYTSNVKNYYLSQGNAASVTVYVTDFSIALKRSSSDGSYIAGIEEHNFTSFGVSNSSISPLFKDALSVLGIPSATISSLLSGKKATCTESAYTNSYTVKVSNMSASQSPNFDSISCGMPIIFQLNKGANTSGSCTYVATTSIKYGVIFVPSSPAGSGARNYYVDGGSSSKTVSLTLS